MMMTEQQRRLVKDSLDSLLEYSDGFALLFYGRLFEMDPGSRGLFHNDLALQGRKLVDMVASIAGSLDDLSASLPVLAALGRKHAGYGVRPDQYDTVSSALLWSLAQTLGPNFDAPTSDAWRQAIDIICTAMKSDLA